MSFFSVLVTGANRGIGLEFVRQFLSLSPPPKHIIVTCRAPESADELKKLASSASGQVHVLALDVKNYASYSGLVEQVGQIVGNDGLGLLVNNAGIASESGLEEVTPQEMMENFEVNSVTPLMITKALLPLLQLSAGKRKTSVVNISSREGSIEDNSSGGYYAYRTSKTALNMITKSLSVDLKPKGIQVIALHPGWVKTDMGGPGAKMTVEESVNSLIPTIKGFKENDIGKMLDYVGKVIPW